MFNKLYDFLFGTHIKKFFYAWLGSALVTGLLEYVNYSIFKIPFTIAEHISLLLGFFIFVETFFDATEKDRIKDEKKNDNL